MCNNFFTQSKPKCPWWTYDVSMVRAVPFLSPVKPELQWNTEKIRKFKYNCKKAFSYNHSVVLRYLHKLKHLQAAVCIPYFFRVLCLCFLSFIINIIIMCIIIIRSLIKEKNIMLKIYSKFKKKPLRFCSLLSFFFLWNYNR